MLRAPLDHGVLARLLHRRGPSLMASPACGWVEGTQPKGLEGGLWHQPLRSTAGCAACCAAASDAIDPASSCVYPPAACVQPLPTPAAPPCATHLLDIVHCVVRCDGQPDVLGLRQQAEHSHVSVFVSHTWM